MSPGAPVRSRAPRGARGRERPRVAGLSRALARLVLPGIAAAGLSVAPAAAEAPLSLDLARPQATGSDRLVTEAEWARELVRALGLEAALPADAPDSDRFSLLCADRAELALGAGGRQLPADAAFRAAVAISPRDHTQGVARAVVRVPATALYQLSVDGLGMQRWVIDQRPVEHLDLSPLGTTQSAAVVPLRAGPHEVAGYLAGGGRVDRVELVAHRTLCIAPADGWHAERPLRQGSFARTLVHAFDLTRELPVLGSERATLEGEKYESTSGGGAVTNRDIGPDASAGRWAWAASGPAEFTWNFRLEEPRVVTLRARVHGVQRQIWSVDGRYRITVEPRNAAGGFGWTHVVSLPLNSGRHAVRALVARGAGVDAIELLPHRSTDGDYVDVLDDLGLAITGASALVSRHRVDSALSSTAFARLAQVFTRRLQGDLGQGTLALVDLDADPMVSRPLAPGVPAEF